MKKNLNFDPGDKFRNYKIFRTSGIKIPRLKNPEVRDENPDRESLTRSPGFKDFLNFAIKLKIKHPGIEFDE